MSDLDSIVATARVVSTQRLSPHFVRIEFGGEELAEFGVDGPYLDQRFKLIFPTSDKPLPDLRQAGDDWYTFWDSLPDDERGSMRTYSVREVRGEGSERRIVVDFVLHLAPGSTGPAATWASSAQPGDQLVVVGPRLGYTWGGIEFDSGDAERIVLAGDETAVPAISRILGDLSDDIRGHAFMEVPLDDDVVPITVPAGFEVTWLPRNGADHGQLLIEAVLAHLGTRQHEAITDEEVDDDLWETPTYSSSEEDLDAAGAPGIPGLYVWIAGESKVVTTLRRHLVNDLGVDRKQVAFMGYWRRGVAMRG